MKSIKKSELFERFFFIVIIIIWFYSDYYASFNDDLKYVVALLYGILLIIMIRAESNSINNKKRINRLLIVYFFMVLVSYFFQLYNSSYSFLPLKHLFYYVTPMLLAYTIYCRDSKNSDFYLNVIFYITTIVFLIEARNILNFSSITQISFLSSYSPFEEIGLADYFLLLFCYYLKREKTVKCVISAFLCFLCFKRFHVVFMILIYLYYLIKMKNKNRLKETFNNKKLYISVCLLFIISPFIMILVYSPDFSAFFYNKFGIILNNFSMGRYNLTNFVLSAYRNNDLINIGLGSTGEYLKYHGYLANMHNDTLRLMLETTFFGTIIFYTNHFKNAYKLPYTTIILLFICITMCISHIMTNFMTWFIFYFIMFMEGDEVYEK